MRITSHRFNLVCSKRNGWNGRGGKREGKKGKKKNRMERRNDDDQILDDFSRRRISFLAPIIKTLETEEVEERKWKVKWLESGLISMQNARLVRGARVESLVPLSLPPFPFISDRQPCWIQPSNPFRTLPSPSPSPLSLPYVSFLRTSCATKAFTTIVTISIIRSQFTLFSSLIRYIKYIKYKKKKKKAMSVRTFRVFSQSEERKKARGKKKGRRKIHLPAEFTSRIFSVT